MDNKDWNKDSIQWQRAKAQYASSGITIEEVGEDNLIRISQNRFDGARLFSQKELVERARTLYPDKKYKIIPNTFSFNASDITPEWIREQMAYYRIKPKDLVRQLGIRASYISEVINGSQAMSAPMSALFFYYFQTKRLGYELAQDITPEAIAEALAIVKERRKAKQSDTSEG